MSKIILEKFHAECTERIQSELGTRLSSTADQTAVCEYYFTEYQRCMNEEKNLIDYFNEQLTVLEDLKSCETSMDAFLERLKAVHQYERRQNEIFEQILRQLTKTDNTSKEETLRLLGQIDELITSKAKLLHPPIHKLPTKSSDTFKNIL